MKIDLTGKWLFKSLDEENFSEAVVPGCNLTDLMMHGVLPDLFYKDNEKLAEPYTAKDWQYRKTFTVTAELLACDKVFLVAKQLDTLCFICINDKKIGDAANCHIEQRFDVKEYLTEGENVIDVVFVSPTAAVAKINSVIKATVNMNGQRGISHVRKPAYHFGWDWGPVLPYVGITDDIYIEGIVTAEITDFKVTQFHHYDGAVTLTVSCRAEKYDQSEITSLFSVKAPDGTEFNAKGLDQGDGLFKAEIEITNPKLWWTRELSGTAEQPLYEVIASLLCGENVVAGEIIKIGLRTIKLLRNKDEYGQNFCFELNGVQIFAKGANLIPPHSFITRFSDGDWDKLLSAVCFSNMNMLRVWGGGYYGSDAFYDKCDKLGILVWQDFPYACQGYPFFLPEYLKAVLNEATVAVKRIRHHASLALWCGNNEIESMSYAWYYMPKYIDSAESFFYHALPELLKTLDDRDYIAGSPTGLDYLYGYDADNVGDTHLWAVWHGLQPLTYYRKRMTRFCSEYGFESMPDEKTVKTFADEADYDFKSATMRSHQKCGSGNQKMKYYIAGRFNLPARFTDYIYLSQVCQSECIRDAAEHWRRNKGRCNGALYWQLNDCWPVISWSGMDFCGRYKALQYCARRFFRPVTVSIEDSDGGFYIYTLNDTNDAYSAHLTFKVCDYDGKVLVEKEKDVDIAAGESKQQLAVGMAIIRNQDKHLRAYAVAILTIGDKEIGCATVLLRKEKFAKLPVPTITKTVEFEGDGVLKITLLSDKYARFVRLDNSLIDAPFSDNWFDLLPAEPKVVYQNLGKTCPLEMMEKAISVFSAAELSKKGNCFTDTLVRASVYYRPVNFFSHLGTKRVPKAIKQRYIMDYDKYMNGGDNE